MDAEFLAGLKIGVFAGIVGGLLGVLCVVLMAVLSPPKPCPGCGAKLPRVRLSRTFRQMLWGGQSCPVCGCEVDRKGRLVE